MKILFLNGWANIPDLITPLLVQNGHDVANLLVQDDDFETSLVSAQAVFDQVNPEMIIGSYQGGALAMNLKTSDVPLLLMCPNWKECGEASELKAQSVVIHCPEDKVVPYADSEELIARSNNSLESLVAAGDSHFLNNNSAIAAILWAISSLAKGEFQDQAVKPLVRVPEEKQLSDQVAAFFERLKSEFVPWIEQSTIPFVHLRKDPNTNDHGILGKDRTGVFINIGHDYFILTAAHGIQESVENDTYLYMSWDDEEGCPIPPSIGDQYATSDPQTVDVSAIKLSQETFKKLLKRHKPISLEHTEFGGQSCDGFFLIVGFPRAGTEFPTQNALEKLKEPIYTPLLYLAQRNYDGWHSSDLTYSSALHLIVDMPRNSIFMSSQTEALLPDHQGVEGISGCGIWHIPKKPLNTISITDCKLVAIEHSYDEKAKKVAGTWIDKALIVLAYNFPDTKP